MKKNDNMKNMVKNSQMIITGDNGDELLKYFSDTVDLVNQPNND